MTESSQIDIRKACDSIPFFKFESEVWKLANFPEYSPFYVSSHGRVRTIKYKMCNLHYSRAIIKKVHVYVYYENNFKRTSRPVDRLILSTFLSRQDDTNIIHIDGDITNNYLDNLKYET